MLTILAIEIKTRFYYHDSTATNFLSTNYESATTSNNKNKLFINYKNIELYKFDD